MDASRQTVNDANTTGVSMYLSFDSSMSSAAFRTLEATSNDTSVLSNGDETAENSHVDCRQDSTLEAQDHSHTSYLRSVKKMEEALSPLCAFPKNILQENRAACSTPAKEQLVQSRMMTRNCKVEQCLEVETKSLLAERREEDKENTQPLNEKAASSTMSVEVVSTVIKGNNNKLTTIEEVCVREVTQQQLSSDETGAMKEADETQEATIPDAVKGKTDTTVSTTALVKQLAFDRNNIRKTVCEPNLQTNRPSRIVPKRSSPTNVVSKPKAEADQEIMADIPKLLDKMLKISNNTTTDSKKMPAPVNNVRGRKSVVGVGATKNRPSMLPAPLAEKRPFNFTQRMSMVVKTTLNSPARKVARKSVLPPGQPMRRSMLPTRSDTNTARRSMLPASKVIIAPATAKQKITQRKPSYSTQEKQQNQVATHKPESKLEAIFDCPMCDAKFRIKSLLEAHKLSHANDPPAPRPIVAPSKAEMFYLCGMCDAKFRIKSLLEAHKRSHEDGAPAFVRKPATMVGFSGTGNTFDNAENKCKFCDKKFALARALHIHLMQNCPKIPPNEKRKLEFTEMNHVEKAQLPMFFHANNSGNNAQMVPPPRSRSNLSNLSASSAESAGEKADATIIPKQMSGAGDGVATQMAPPSVNKVKKKTAHSGVYRTPNKSIICHICNKSFKSVMDHIQHNMAVHFNHPNIDYNGTDAGLPKELLRENKSIE